jgi:hypothetical protein
MQVNLKKINLELYLNIFMCIYGRTPEASN